MKCMRIYICGDICPTEVNAEFIRGNIGELFNDVPSVFSDGDRVLINLECALTDQNTPIFKKGPNLKASPCCAEVLKKVGVTDCGLSNNHIFDFGLPGVADTLEALENAGFSWTGFGDNYDDSRKNLVWSYEGKTVAVIAVCEHEYSYALENRPGARPFDPIDTLEDIRSAKGKFDYVIVTYHGGKEQSVYPSPRLRKICQAMVRSGADAVFCQHSHCIGCYEEYRGGHILYGQGNFHFVEKKMDHPHWQNGLIAALTITDKVDVAWIPVVVDGKGIRLPEESERQRILDMLCQQSENLQNGKWLELWGQHCQENRVKYIGNISRAYTDQANPDDNILFNGRMHCEAHKDVIDWLCKHPWETESVL